MKMDFTRWEKNIKVAVWGDGKATLVDKSVCPAEEPAGTGALEAASYRGDCDNCKHFMGAEFPKGREVAWGDVVPACCWKKVAAAEPKGGLNVEDEKKVTELEEYRSRRKRYPWGRILEIHDVGTRYAVLEFEPHKSALNSVEPQAVSFTAFVDGRTVAGASTFDGALLLCIAAGNMGRSEAMSGIGAAAERLLCVKPPK